MTLHDSNPITAPAPSQERSQAQASALPAYGPGGRRADDLTDDLDLDDLELSLRSRGYVRQPPQTEKIKRFVSE
jgi:hypothetical protein